MIIGGIYFVIIYDETFPVDIQIQHKMIYQNRESLRAMQNVNQNHDSDDDNSGLLDNKWNSKTNATVKVNARIRKKVAITK